MAYRIKLKKADENSDLGASKFFGAPTIPNAWNGEFDDDVLFFAQIRLSDLKDLKKEIPLPEEGYLYFFLETAYHPFELITKYSKELPDTVIDDFNEYVEGFSHLTESYEMIFEECEDDKWGNKLFGVPAEWCYAEPPQPLFLQFDPLDESVGFLSEVDGYAYLFFEDDTYDLEKLTFRIERS